MSIVKSIRKQEGFITADEALRAADEIESLLKSSANSFEVAESACRELLALKSALEEVNLQLKGILK